MRRKQSLNRRQFLGAVGAGVGVAGCAANSGVPDLFPPGMNPGSTATESRELAVALESSALRSMAEPRLPTDPKALLLDHITYGTRPADITEINNLGYSAYLERQLNPEIIDDWQMNARLMPFTSLSLDATTISGMGWDRSPELGAAALLRAVYSKRQLHEKMVEFWSDHFNINQFATNAWYHKPVDDREVIRPYALGRFRDLLLASARSPAMLVYLNGNENRAGHPNENYAREVMELHTVGVNAGYTHRDVQDMARAMTGWTVGASGPNFNLFEFRSEFHDTGPKQIMGLSLPAGGGISDGEQALNYLAAHPATARNIVEKLVAYFISEDLPQALVNQATTRFTITGGDIKATLRVILKETAITQATPKIKRPLHLIADIARKSAATVSATTQLVQIPAAMGHQPFTWSMPDGFPQRSDYWAPGLLSRWNVITLLAGGSYTFIPISPYYMGQAAGAVTTDQVVALWNQKFFGGRMSTEDQAQLAAYINRSPDNLLRKYNESFVLALSLSDFQYY
ncbi:MAG TPA: DUF1800 domain-containing protein [Phycisphaerae bacterium]|nr:DUF1800 domain-containing protein [Phycisphaerae bacterium]